MHSPTPFPVHTDHTAYTSSAGSTQRTNTVADPFYSDQDVVILHDIVALAQDELAKAPDPKPLPAAALFKAYDEVLPQYGVDPDGDHHLSAFIFRIGGEEGNAPLLDKFQSILGHLGITVELGDDLEYDVSHSPAPSTTRSVRSVFNRALRLLPRTDYADAVLRRQTLARVPELEGASRGLTQESSLASPVAIASGRQFLRQNVDGLDDASSVGHDVLEAGEDKEAASSAPDDLARRHVSGPPSQLESDLNRWITAAKAQRGNIFTSPARSAATSNRQVTEALTPERPVESRQSQISQSMRDQLARPPNPSPPSLLSLIDGWQVATLRPSKESDNGAPSPDDADSPNVANPIRQVRNARVSIPTSPHHPELGDEQRDMLEPRSATKHAAARAILSQAKQEEAQRQAIGAPATREQLVQMQVQRQKLLFRAARARELYLASKFFNHWADRTARRLEREGVARRHMVRFRCFRGWSHMPTSRDSNVDQLRMSAACHRMRRTISEHRGELESLAHRGVQLRERASAFRALNVWRQCVKVSEAQARAAERIKARAALRWRMQAAAQAAALEAARLRGQQALEISSLAIWQEQARENHERSIAARDIGDANIGFTHLRSWWDRSETSRRAAVFRKYLDTEKVAQVASIWSLAARSQAFKWNSDYKTVSFAFDKWEDMKQHYQKSAAAAQSHYSQRTGRRVLRSFSQARRDQKRVHHVQGRIRLYIAGSKTLNIFVESAKRQKAEEKQRVKELLISKFRQISSARKKRHFYTALSRWQEAATVSHVSNQLIVDSQGARENRKRNNALEAWSVRSSLHQQSMNQAVQSYGLSWLDRWAALGAGEMDHEARAWETWVAERQRTALKSWSIMALQQGGQAHTAVVAYHKYGRDRRRRALQRWKQQADKETAGENMDLNVALTPGPGSLRSYRQSWRLFSERNRGKSNRSSAMSTTDTPTRWTGHLSLMSSTMGQNPMPALEEMDEKAGAKSPVPQDMPQRFWSPIRGRADNKLLGGLASTTPLGLPPSNLNPKYDSSLEESGGRPPEPRSAANQHWQYVPSRLGPAHDKRSFPRSLQDRSSDEPSGLSTGTATGSSLLFSRTTGHGATVAGSRALTSKSSAALATPQPQSRKGAHPFASLSKEEENDEDMSYESD